MLITVAAYTSAIEAHIVRGRLEAEGIHAFVSHEHHVWAKWFISNALGGVKIQVSPVSTDSALAVINKICVGEYETVLGDSEGPYEIIKCPTCSSTSIMENRWNEKLSLIVVWLFSIPLPYAQGSLTCIECKKSWVEKDRKVYPFIAIFFGIIFILIFYMVLIESMYHICRLYGLNDLCYK